MASILVVDDDQALLEAVADVIRDAGHHVSVARNGVEALAALRGQPFQLVVLDLMMPVMDGLTFRREQLADPSIANVPVVVVSAARPMPRIDAAAILSKPFELRDLLDAVQRHAA